MLREKLSEGMLCILTPLGPRYLRPGFWDRLHLVWIFRHFRRLPQQVLSSREQRFIERLCRSNPFLPGRCRNGLEEAPVIGILEHRVPVPLENPRREAEALGIERSPGRPITDEPGSA
jgi:hypothetical protein